jgi:transcriptional regulator with XRE-family HTH domain
MEGGKWFEKMLDSVKETFGFRVETIILNLTEQISRRMEEKRISRKDLAKALNVSPAAVTKILNGSPNFTIKTLLSLADALNLKLEIRFVSEIVTCQIPLARGQVTSLNSASDIGWNLGATSSLSGPRPDAPLAN